MKNDQRLQPPLINRLVMGLVMGSLGATHLDRQGAKQPALSFGRIVRNNIFSLLQLYL